MSELEVPKTDVVKRNAGRPKKGEVVAKKSKNRGTLGRPAGDKAIMDEYKARMLNSPKSARVLEAIFDAALDPEHKAQSAAWKLIVDRIVPVSSFEQAKAAGAGGASITINVSGISSPTVEAEEVRYDIEDVEVKDTEE